MKKQQGSIAAILLFILLIAILGWVAWWVWNSGQEDEEEAETSTSISVSDVGFQTPESVLYDAEDDTYLVSNINGQALEANDDGFISRVDPEGNVVELKWIDGADEDVTLNAPKGMAIVGDELFVSDIDTVRVFDRSSGDPVRTVSISDTSFLNDVTAANDGTVYVSDSGLDADFASTGTDAIYAIDGEDVTEVYASTDMSSPNGLVLDDGAILIAQFSGDKVLSLEDDSLTEVATLPSDQLDGLVQLEDGTLLVSSWGGEAVYRISPSNEVTVEVEDVPAPADIGFDTSRDRVLIPLFNDNAVEIRSVAE